MLRLILKNFYWLISDYTIKGFDGSLQSNYKEPIN